MYEVPRCEAGVCDSGWAGWKLTDRGNLTCVLSGYRVTIFGNYGLYGYVIARVVSDTEDDEPPTFSTNRYPTEESARGAAVSVVKNLLGET